MANRCWNMPDQGSLDPAGLARDTDMYDTGYLMVYPYREYQTADVIEISEILNQQTSRQQGV